MFPSFLSLTATQPPETMGFFFPLKPGIFVRLTVVRKWELGMCFKLRLTWVFGGRGGGVLVGGPWLFFIHQNLC